MDAHILTFSVSLLSHHAWLGDKVAKGWQYQKTGFLELRPNRSESGTVVAIETSQKQQSS